MRAIERQWANAVLSGFLVGELPREQGAAPPLGDVDYSSGIASLIEHGNPIASAGVRVALATIVTAPLWHWGQRRTMVDMSPEERWETALRNMGIEPGLFDGRVVASA